MNEAQINATKNPAAGLIQAAEREDRRVLRLVLFDALASEAMGTLTTRVFLVGFAVALGADNFAIGVLAAVPFFAQLLQIPAVLLVERWRVRRDICVFSTALGRAFLVGAAAAPLIGGALGIKVLIASLAIYQGMAAIAGCAWNSWMRDLRPIQRTRTLFWTAHTRYIHRASPSQLLWELGIASEFNRLLQNPSEEGNNREVSARASIGGD